MEVRNKNLSICVGVSKRVPDIAVSITIPASGISDQCLKELICNCAGDKELREGSEMAALVYAIFEQIRDKLVGSALELSKSRVSNVSCSAIHNNFVIRWNCQGTGSSLRKTCGLAASCMNPAKLFSKYSENIKFLSGKTGSREHFNYCAKKIAESIKKGVTIAAVGKINLDKDKLGEILKVVGSKFPDIEVPKEIETPPKHEGHVQVHYPLVKASGFAAACVADYIRSNSAGMGVQVVNSGVVVYNQSWETKHKQLREDRRIKDYVLKKYERLGAEFPALFAYFATTQGYADGETVAKIIKSKPKPAELVALIKAALK
jgi:hypothetical protein